MKITNPYALLQQHFCFGCSAKNPIGLQLNFNLEGKKVVSYWTPDERYQGFHRVLHGGIQATLLDEVAGWVVQVICQTSGVTSEMKVQYHKPVYTHEKNLRIEAEIIGYRNRLVDIEARLFNESGNLCSTAIVTYYLFSEEVAKEKFNYPGADSFGLDQQDRGV